MQAQRRTRSTLIPPGGRVATADRRHAAGHRRRARDGGQPRSTATPPTICRSYGKDPKTGKIVQSKDRIHTKFNYATSYPGFQAGSTFKMFTLAAALEKGLSTSTTFFSPACIYLTNFGDNPTGGNSQCIADVPTRSVVNCRRSGRATSNSDPAEAGIYNMASGTAHSVNTYFVQLEKKVGSGRSATWRSGSASARRR